MNTKQITETLQGHGIKMRISHFRKLTGNAPVGANTYVPLSHIQSFNLQKFISGKGGKTKVALSKEDGIRAVSIAECHDVDSFSKRRGVRIAVARALKALDVKIDELI